jgi:DNA cross-link repair 1A protein
VTAFDANHCPGACLLLFETPKSRSLHVGDFRWNGTQILNSSPLLAKLKPREINYLYLDTTFNDAKYDFPPQDEVDVFFFVLVVGFLKETR